MNIIQYVLLKPDDIILEDGSITFSMNGSDVYYRLFYNIERNGETKSVLYENAIIKDNEHLQKLTNATTFWEARSNEI